MKKTALLLLFSFFVAAPLRAEDGYRLWLRYDKITDIQKLSEYKLVIQGWIFEDNSPISKAAKNELSIGLNGLLGLYVAVLQQGLVGWNGHCRNALLAPAEHDTF